MRSLPSAKTFNSVPATPHARRAHRPDRMTSRELILSPHCPQEAVPGTAVQLWLSSHRIAAVRCVEQPEEQILGVSGTGRQLWLHREGLSPQSRRPRGQRKGDRPTAPAAADRAPLGPGTSVHPPYCHCSGWDSTAGLTWPAGLSEQPLGTHFPRTCLVDTRVFPSQREEPLSSKECIL